MTKLEKIEKLLVFDDIPRFRLFSKCSEDEIGEIVEFLLSEVKRLREGLSKAYFLIELLDPNHPILEELHMNYWRENTSD